MTLTNFLQIRNILSKGPAHQDGVLQTGKGLIDGWIDGLMKKLLGGWIDRQKG